MQIHVVHRLVSRDSFSFSRRKTASVESRGRLIPSVAIVVGALLLGLTTVGCGASDDYGGAPWSGNSGPGSVPPECGALNQACLARGLNAPLALGSYLELDLDYQIGGTSGPPTTLETADASVLTASEMTVQAVGVGASAVLFVGPDNAIIDFLHVWVAEPDELRIYRYTEAGVQLGRVQDEVTLLTGDEVLIFVEPFANAQPLMGNFSMTRTQEGTSIAVVPDVVGGLYRVVARAAGHSSVTFHGLGMDQLWQVEVLP